MLCLLSLAAAPAGEDNAHSGVARLRARVGVCLPYLGGAWVERCDRIPGADQVDWAEEAEQGFRLAQAADAASRRAAWRDWVDGALRCRPGLLYRWVRGEVRLPPVATTVDGRWTLDPGAVVEVEAKKWSELWSPLGVECWAPRSPSGPLLRALDGAVLRGIARGLRPRVAAGADGWRALELKELPEVFWDRLADFLGACEAVGRWPEPLRVGIVALLPRPIVLLPLVYRIWAAARRPEVRAWVAGAGADGAEIPGRGADEAALEAECLGDETGDEDETLCGVFLDCSKCYERVPLQQLDAKASEALFPDKLLVLALGMYSGRRHVRVGPAVARAVQGSCGLMAGCGLANALLRAHFREAVQAARGGAAGEAAVNQEAAPRVRRYVDDWAPGPRRWAPSRPLTGWLGSWRRPA